MSMTDGFLRLAMNLHFAWDHPTQALFAAHNPDAYQARHAPLDVVRSGAKEGCSADAAAQLTELSNYMSDTTWGDAHAGRLKPAPVAYFSAEFGLHESLPIYSGGLGVLAGDHLKSASDLGLPLVGVGLFYRGGYFGQRLDAEGWQQEDYPRLEAEEAPLTRVEVDGARLIVSVETRSETISAQVFLAQVGRIRLFLLDTDVPQNSDTNRALTANLYGGDEHTRIRQELVLGVGGLRALRAMQIRPGVMHLNEGHSSFVALEAIAQSMEYEGISFEEARLEVAARTVFTTHTPVPAGHDRFARESVEEHLGPIRDRLGISQDALFEMGRDGDHETFCMTALALGLTERTNGVSFLHGRVSRRMWKHLFPGRKEHEVPIGHITNGVHVPTWTTASMLAFYDRVLPSDWRHRQWDPAAWAPILEVPDEVLYAQRCAARESLAGYVQERAAMEASARGEAAEVVDALREAPLAEGLLVGFARRFATYKRATLLLRDLDRLDALINAPGRPVRFIFAGKAHPRDEGGKKLIQRLHRASREPRFLGKLIVLENYDMALGRALTGGVDVWLNNPRRPLEASGTSGQKVVLNGGLNCSVLDGWWAEGYEGDNGFAIGNGEVHRDARLQDDRDAIALHQVFAEEVVPLFFERTNGVPLGFVHRMKRSIATLAWRFNSDRMVRDYAQSCYLPAAGGVLCA